MKDDLLGEEKLHAPWPSPLALARPLASNGAQRFCKDGREH
jgi:hypothetical protein